MLQNDHPAYPSAQDNAFARSLVASLAEEGEGSGRDADLRLQRCLLSACLPVLVEMVVRDPQPLSLAPLAA